MFRHLLIALFSTLSMSAFAALDVNKATQAELETIKGIGTSMSEKIIGERKKGNFKSWGDMVDRVKGIGDGNATKFSAEGLTVGGASYKRTTSADAASTAKPAQPQKPDAAPPKPKTSATPPAKL